MGDHSVGLFSVELTAIARTGDVHPVHLTRARESGRGRCSPSSETVVDAPIR
jgi:hypothetical protein